MGLPDERELIAAITRDLESRDNRAGLISDCAVVEIGETDLVATVDGFAEATHFPDGLPAPMAGHLAAGATLADLAAAGADPIGLLAAYGIPASLDRDRVLELAHAVAATVEDVGGEVLGGDTKPRDELSVTLTALGTCPTGEAMTRDRARAGDVLVVTGPLGGAGAALDRIRQGLPPGEADPLVPTPRIAAGRTLREAGVGCAMDLSDGLADAAVAIGEASGMQVRVVGDRVPLHPWTEDREHGLDHALTTGGDYELVAAVPGDLEERTLDALAEIGLEAQAIGRVEEGEGALLEGREGERELERGYVHAFTGGG